MKPGVAHWILSRILFGLSWYSKSISFNWRFTTANHLPLISVQPRENISQPEGKCCAFLSLAVKLGNLEVNRIQCKKCHLLALLNLINVVIESAQPTYHTRTYFTLSQFAFWFTQWKIQFHRVCPFLLWLFSWIKRRPREKEIILIVASWLVVLKSKYHLLFNLPWTKTANRMAQCRISMVPQSLSSLA